MCFAYGDAVLSVTLMGLNHFLRDESTKGKLVLIPAGRIVILGGNATKRVYVVWRRDWVFRFQLI